jgi:hypothetical protein
MQMVLTGRRGRYCKAGLVSAGRGERGGSMPAIFVDRARGSWIDSGLARQAKMLSPSGVSPRERHVRARRARSLVQETGIYSIARRRCSIGRRPGTEVACSSGSTIAQIGGKRGGCFQNATRSRSWSLNRAPRMFCRRLSLGAPCGWPEPCMYWLGLIRIPVLVARPPNRPLGLVGLTRIRQVSGSE